MKMLPEVYNENFDFKGYKKILVKDVFNAFISYCNVRSIDIHYNAAKNTFFVTQKDYPIKIDFTSRILAILWILENKIQIDDSI